MLPKIGDKLKCIANIDPTDDDKFDVEIGKVYVVSHLIQEENVFILKETGIGRYFYRRIGTIFKPYRKQTIII